MKTSKALFSPGTTWLVRERDFNVPAKMDFGLLRLLPGSRHCFSAKAEVVVVLLHGRARVTVAGQSVVATRRSVFEQGPFTVSLGRDEKAEIQSQTASEWVVMRTTTSKARGARLYRPADCAGEDRGAGLAQGACRRLVRTIFDYTARPDSSFVVGEVINLPGRWSSYPPHHHPQPEIYHYRFTAPQGYGHAETGERVHRVMSGDTTVIPGGCDHAQVSAPGYGMYYLWVVRHLPRNPYRGFTVTKAHQWLLDPHQQGWKPSPHLFA
ncbi:5-deoxy-glucuronate isomerase [Opitutus sp. GAS368]|uniref:5-deoxy-glucuronate isomerase n=1 Tax=Opitutus sp. GAS368 TaxID=1882749 RepID=UPI00087AC905|nr:5-deoxy-glucuronate isomerase [Opitutus sp. GAS368]SDS18227.1 5-deoxyglucuronate isomerase [Opitutus sp. GAS368]